MAAEATLKERCAQPARIQLDQSGTITTDRHRCACSAQAELSAPLGPMPG